MDVAHKLTSLGRRVANLTQRPKGRSFDSNIQVIGRGAWKRFYIAVFHQFQASLYGPGDRRPLDDGHPGADSIK
ncbi:unnamed protein product [Colias eurytheme]|nr:unnamed protein product [Colias eurytheme]